jgi:hypothetical protein
VSFSKTYYLLEKEGLLIRSTLSLGLTALRNATLNSKDKYYSAFFELSIGLERLMKTTLILAHMSNNRLAPPTQSALKKLGHDLETLFAECKKLEHSCSQSSLSQLSTSSTPIRILIFLSKFARGDRYHNIDALTGAGAVDPLANWKEILDHILLTDVSAEQIRRATHQSLAISSRIADITFTVTSDLDDTSLNVHQALAIPSLQELAARHAVWHVHVILVGLADLLDCVTTTALQENAKVGTSVAHIPHMREFFHFLGGKRADVLKKKRWP